MNVAISWDICVLTTAKIANEYNSKINSFWTKMSTMDIYCSFIEPRQKIISIYFATEAKYPIESCKYEY